MEGRPGDPYHDEHIAAVFADHAEDSAYNAHYDRPAVLEEIGDVAGLRVLDAACGPGIYAEVFRAAGADVTGFDASEPMLAIARERLGDEVPLLHAALGEELPLGPDSFDLVVCALAIHYAPDRRAVFAEFHRLLRPGGEAVVSTTHPMNDWLRRGGSYFDVQRETELWSDNFGETEFPFWREPLQSLCDAAIDAGFLIGRIVEPLPAPSMAERWPDDHEKLTTRPDFLILRLVKPPFTPEAASGTMSS